MKIAIGADHAGVDLKDQLAGMLREAGHEVEDHGTFGPDSVDYPDFAAAVGSAVSSEQAERGVLVCGSGLGVAIAANKVDGVRAVTCNDLYTAELCRAHNDANVIALGARIVGGGLAEAIVRTFLSTDFDGGPRHRRRVDKIHTLENSLENAS